ncbi:DivIVA domain-containing protein [Microbacterium sp. ZXX196]|uniref:DivIVA domain-containing protein n=1 Tax=Microbacterium sp. ZXX196 TaxID=2609291 RepID=UPI0012B97E85|nr:DivIVA domain-containing protein [Microbacterium sp. ZXX196]MTE23690.1 DivIVA domain-containing protein [Microbacterium sp. ZXX196]
MTTDKTADAPAASFPRAARGARGYDPASVEGFLARARASFDGTDPSVGSVDVRQASFPLVRGGFDIRVVDGALARLEDAFAQREREESIASDGADTWIENAREEARELLARLSRPAGSRFRRVPWFHSGYAVAEVDIVADRVARYFSDGEYVGVDQVRQAAFHTQRGGYREDQVDAVLDAVVRVILAVR